MFNKAKTLYGISSLSKFVIRVILREMKLTAKLLISTFWPKKIRGFWF